MCIRDRENIETFLQIVLKKEYTLSERTLLSLECNPENEQINELNFAMNEVTAVSYTHLDVYKRQLQY